MATDAITQYTYADLAGFPDDNLRREIIDGELIVTPSPIPRHQDAVMVLSAELYRYVRAHGGKVYPAPLDVFFSDRNVVEPDVLFISAEHVDRIGSKYVKDAPDLVVEVSSPSTRRLELVRKRDLYERFGVPEYWYVDLDADRAEIYRLVEGRFAPPTLLGRTDRLESPLFPGWSLSVDEVLGPPDA
jgi:Uma2 family endonuclease